MLDTEYFPSNCLGREKEKKKKEDLVKKISVTSQNALIFASFSESSVG